jgi:hypothetical protein
VTASDRGTGRSPRRPGTPGGGAAPIASAAVRGTLISVAPAACELGHLLRLAIDAEQVGATRIHLAIDQPDFVAAVGGLRGQTDLVITADPDHDGSDLVDRVPPDFTEVVLDGDDPTTLTAEVARMAAAARSEISFGGRGPAAVPVLFAAIAVGADLLVGTALSRPEPADPAAGSAGRSAPGRDDAALVARASGLARIAGRAPTQGRAARSRWHVG